METFTGKSMVIKIVVGLFGKLSIVDNLKLLALRSFTGTFFVYGTFGEFLLRRLIRVWSVIIFLFVVQLRYSKSSGFKNDQYIETF